MVHRATQLLESGNNPEPGEVVEKVNVDNWKAGAMMLKMEADLQEKWANAPAGTAALKKALTQAEEFLGIGTTPSGDEQSAVGSNKSLLH